VAFNFRLNVQNVFRRLGIQTGARLPQLNENVQMTMLLTDLSRLVPAPIEPRGLCGANLSGSLGNLSICQLQSLSPGGIFIEQIFFRTQSFPTSENYFLNVTTFDVGAPVNTDNINVGGDPPISTIFTAGELPVAASGARMPAASGQQNVALAVGIFIPNQSFFSVMNGTFNKRLDVGILYRELPSVEEVTRDD